MSLVGGQGDGAMWTCDPHRLIKRTDCVIYSVGSDGVFDFEDGIVDLLGSKHCEIHVFDTIDQERVGDPELRNIFFHKWGIHSSYDEVYNAEMVRDGLEGLKPEFDSLPHTMKDRFLEENRTIDILKIDCDGCEWYVPVNNTKGMRLILIYCLFLLHTGDSLFYFCVCSGRRTRTCSRWTSDKSW
jgi:hypothetical protein